MDCKIIQEKVQKFLYEKSNIYQALNFSKCGYYEADILAMTKSRVVTEVEVKISRSDFKADFKKRRKHDALKGLGVSLHRPRPNKMYYACPQGLIKPEEIPEYAGLIYVNVDTVEIVKKAPVIHKDKASDKLVLSMLEALTSKEIWGMQYLTHLNNEIQKYNQARRDRQQRDWEEYHATIR